MQDENGQRLYYYVDGFSTTKREGFPEAELMTDRNGRFTLKAGWTAVFDGVEEDSTYEIEEESLSEWSQIVPAGGVAAVGTVTKDGALATFTNRYEPTTPPEIPMDVDIPPESRTSTINITKSIVYPDGYEIPAFRDFSFVLNVNGSPWASKQYTIRSGNTSRTAQTNASGVFTIKSGETASFDNVPENSSYLVTENAVTGWRLVSSTGTHGEAGSSGAHATFTNAGASFGVSKTVAGENGDTTPFTYVLTDENGSPMNASYYLYGPDKRLVDTNAKTTGSGGTFTLTSGQTAIFFGIAPGTKYNVMERAVDGYQQVTPGVRAGYTNKEVLESVEVVPFINRKADLIDLTIEKEVTGSHSNRNKVFNFTVTFTEGLVRLLDKYEVTAGGSTSMRPLETGMKYTFSLKDGQTFKVSDLPAGTQYIVQESDYSGEYYNTITTNASGELTEDVTAHFRNHETHTDVPFAKVDRNGDIIAGAALRITGREDGASSDITPITFTSGTDGKTGNKFNPHTVTLLPGTYTLTETSVPTGYVQASPVTFVVDNRGAIKVGTNTVSRVEMLDEYVRKDLTVKKTVTGNMGSRDKNFSFKLKLKMNNTPFAREQITTVKNGVTQTVTTDANGEVSFTLGHNDTIVFKNLMYTTAYEVTETNYASEGYRTTYSNNATGTMGVSNITVNVTNARGTVVPTGVHTRAISAIFVIMMAWLAMCIALLVKHIRNEEM